LVAYEKWLGRGANATTGSVMLVSIIFILSFIIEFCSCCGSWCEPANKPGCVSKSFLHACQHWRCPWSCTDCWCGFGRRHLQEIIVLSIERYLCCFEHWIHIVVELRKWFVGTLSSHCCLVFSRFGENELVLTLFILTHQVRCRLRI